MSEKSQTQSILKQFIDEEDIVCAFFSTIDGDVFESAMKTEQNLQRISTYVTVILNMANDTSGNEDNEKTEFSRVIIEKEDVIYIVLRVSSRLYLCCLAEPTSSIGLLLNRVTSLGDMVFQHRSEIFKAYLQSQKK